MVLFACIIKHHIHWHRKQEKNQTGKLKGTEMNILNRAFERLVSAREEEAQRYIENLMADHGFDISKDENNNPRG
jgi:hypothetical protein